MLTQTELLHIDLMISPVCIFAANSRIEPFVGLTRGAQRRFWRFLQVFLKLLMGDHFGDFLKVSKISEAWGPPQFQRKNALGVKRRSENISRNAKSHSRNGVSRLVPRENHNSWSNFWSDSRNWWEPTWKFSFAHAFSEHSFKNWGGPHAPEDFLRNLEMLRIFESPST